MTRRQFARTTIQAAGGLLVTLSLPSCTREEYESKPQTSGSGISDHTHTDAAAYTAPSETQFAILEVGGTPYEMGLQIGKRFAGQIREGLEARAVWWGKLKSFAESRPAEIYDTFLAAAQKHTPGVVEELRGWAEGSDVPFRDLMVLNLKAEYEALRQEQKGEPLPPTPGCSTVVCNNGDTSLVAHNEDGNMAYSDRMFLLRMKPEGKPSVFSVSYPGILPGNAPWINDRGVLMTTNYIASREVKMGVGRYFLDRQAMEAGTMDEAQTICRHPERAYAYHHIIGSLTDKRILSLEVTPSQFEEQRIEGLYLHTNHLVLPTMAGTEQDEEYVGSSSISRWRVLTAWRAGLEDQDHASIEQIMAALSSHEGRPYSPCRHPEGNVEGATLLTAVFDLNGRSLRIYKGNPCTNKTHDYPV